ncbi:MAG: hypothetical protein JWO36_361 [Myxococcales bacterium]|nr:hypothetical protein [Myxococcales bacterium]
MRRGWLALAVVLAVAPAYADDAVKVDWARGLVIADGVGVADRHAPNPAVARGTSRRGAEAVAKQLIAAKLRELPLASGAKVADKLKDSAVKARLDQAIEAAISLDAEPETDGAWRVTMAVPIEAVRQAVFGARTVPDKGDAGPAIVVVDGVPVKPAIGWRIGLLDAATVWTRELPAWAKDAPHVTAKRARAGTIEVDGSNATASTLFVIVTP